MTMAFGFFINFMNRTKEVIDWTDTVICTYPERVSITFLNGKNFTEQMFDEFRTFFEFHDSFGDWFDSKDFPDGSRFSFMIRFSDDEEEEEEEE